MPNGRLDEIRLVESGPVAALVVRGAASASTAVAAGVVEARLRGAPLEVVTVEEGRSRRGLPTPRAGPDEEPAPLLDVVLASARRSHPTLPITTRTMEGPLQPAVRNASKGASLLVLGAPDPLRASMWGRGMQGLDLVGASTCPVLMAQAGERGFGRGAFRLVIAQAPEDLELAVPVVDLAAAEAVRRGAELLVLHPFSASVAGGDGVASLRVGDWTGALLAELGLDLGVGPVVTTVHTPQPSSELLVQRSRAAELVVTDDVTATTVSRGLRQVDCDVLVVPTRAHLSRQACLAAYRQALVDELARAPRRGDGCSTPEELDDAWRVGTASPAVSDRVEVAWRACLTQAASTVPAYR